MSTTENFINGKLASITHVTDNSEYIGRSNPTDPFNGYSDFPNTNTVLSPRKSSFSPTTLGTTVKTYTGNQSDITALARWSSLAQYQFSYSIEELPNQLFAITITIPYDEITYEDNNAPEDNQWELVPNSTSRNIFDAGIYYIQANGQFSSKRYTVPPPVQAAIVTAVKNNIPLVLDESTCGTNFAQMVQFSNIATQFYYLLKSQVNTVQAYTVTMRRTAVFSVNDPNAFDDLPDFGESSNLANVNPIISTNDFIINYEIPSNITPFMPVSYQKLKTTTEIINGYADPVTLNAYGGWLIARPQRTFIGPTKIQITQNFIFDEYLGNCYASISEPGDYPLYSNTPYPTGPNS